MYGLCQILLDPRGYNERVGLGFSGRGVSAQSRFPREGRELAVCQHRLSSERGRELWKDVMDRRQGKGKREEERKTEKSEVKRKLGRDTGKAYSMPA